MECENDTPRFNTPKSQKLCGKCYKSRHFAKFCHLTRCSYYGKFGHIKNLCFLKNLKNYNGFKKKLMKEGLQTNNNSLQSSSLNKTKGFENLKMNTLPFFLKKVFNMKKKEIKMY